LAFIGQYHPSIESADRWDLLPLGLVPARAPLSILAEIVSLVLPRWSS